MTALFPNYNSTHSGKTANSQLFNGGQSANAFSTLKDTIDKINMIGALFN